MLNMWLSPSAIGAPQGADALSNRPILVEPGFCIPRPAAMRGRLACRRDASRQRQRSAQMCSSRAPHGLFGHIHVPPPIFLCKEYFHIWMIFASANRTPMPQLLADGCVNTRREGTVGSQWESLRAAACAPADGFDLRPGIAGWLSHIHALSHPKGYFGRKNWQSPALDTKR